MYRVKPFTGRFTLLLLGLLTCVSIDSVTAAQTREEADWARRQKLFEAGKMTGNLLRAYKFESQLRRRTAQYGGEWALLEGRNLSGMENMKLSRYRKGSLSSGDMDQHEKQYEASWRILYPDVFSRYERDMRGIGEMSLLRSKAKSEQEAAQRQSELSPRAQVENDKWLKQRGTKRIVALRKRVEAGEITEAQMVQELQIFGLIEDTFSVESRSIQGHENWKSWALRQVADMERRDGENDKKATSHYGDIRHAILNSRHEQRQELSLRLEEVRRSHFAGQEP